MAAEKSPPPTSSHSPHRPRSMGRARRVWLTGWALSAIFLCMAVIVFALMASLALNWSMVQVAMRSVPAPAIAAPLVETPPPTAAIAIAPTANIARQIAPTATPAAAPTVTPYPQPTPHPLHNITLPAMRMRSYPGGQIDIQAVITTTRYFTGYRIAYPSDGLTITGVMQVPRGNGPFPVVVLAHGYIPRAEYWPGADTWAAAGYLNRQGYLTIAPDFRSWGGSDTGNSFFSMGLVIDTLNLVSSLPSVPQADSQRVGIWGHSMGGGIALKAALIDPRLRAAVLYAPVSADEADNLARWGPGCFENQPYSLAEACGGADVVAETIEPELFLAYANAVYNPAFLERVSAANYLPWLAAPVQIHIGLDDTRTPPEWSAGLNVALTEAGKSVEFYGYPGEGHAFSAEAWPLFMERAATFFDRTLLPE